MTVGPVSRRSRLREQTTREIKETALELMAEGGAEAMTLRGIARKMGMTAGAIYSYFATRDELVTALSSELYTALVDAVETARDAHPPGDPGGRILAWAEAFRAWALANPQGFRLIYGDPVPGYSPPPGGAAPEAEGRACAGLTDLVAAAWPAAEPAHESGDHSWEDFEAGAASATRDAFPDLPPAAAALALRIWARMYGLVALEIYSHLGTQTRRPDKIYRADMRELVASLNLPDA